MEMDYGTWSIPCKWDDVTLKQYEEISRYYGDEGKKFDIRDVIHILCNKSMDEVNSLPTEFLDEILGMLSFLETSPKQEEATNKIVIDGETYEINVQNKLKTGEYIAAESVMRDDKYNYAAMLAILCRKNGEDYDSKFENEVVEERIKMFENMPVTKLIPLVFFFINLLTILETPTLLSTMLLEQINLIRQNITSLRKSGEASILTTLYAKRKLKKLEKTIRCI